MRYVLLILFLFLFFPTASFAGSYPYSGKIALEPGEWGSKWAGNAHEWLRTCAGKYSKHARKIEKEVKRLSTPDYKLFKKAKSRARAKGYTQSSGCDEHGDRTIRDMTQYIDALKVKVDKKLRLSKTTTSSTSSTSSTSRYCQLKSSGFVYNTPKLCAKGWTEVSESIWKAWLLAEKSNTTTSSTSSTSRYCQLKSSGFVYNTPKLCAKGWTEVSESIWKAWLLTEKSNTTKKVISSVKHIYCKDKNNLPRKYTRVKCLDGQIEITKKQYETLRDNPEPTTNVDIKLEQGWDLPLLVGSDGYLHLYCKQKNMSDVVVDYSSSPVAYNKMPPNNKCWSTQLQITKEIYNLMKKGVIYTNDEIHKIILERPDSKTTSFEDQTQSNKELVSGAKLYR